MKIVDHIQKWQVVYTFACGMFTLGVMFSGLQTKEAHASDIQKLHDQDKETVKLVMQVKNEMFNRLELDAVNEKINKIENKSERSVEDQTELRLLEKKQDRLLDLIYGS